MIRSLSSTGPVSVYPFMPVQPVAPIPGSSPDEAQNSPAGDTQIDRLKAFEDYLNGQAAGAPGSTADTANTPNSASSQSDLSAQLQAFEAYLAGQPAPGSGAQASSGFTAADNAKQSIAQDQNARTVLSGLQQQADAFEAYLNQTHILQQSYSVTNSSARPQTDSLFSPDLVQTSDVLSLEPANFLPVQSNDSPGTAAPELSNQTSLPDQAQPFSQFQAGRQADAAPGTQGPPATDDQTLRVFEIGTHLGTQLPSVTDDQTSSNPSLISTPQDSATDPPHPDLPPPPDFGSLINALLSYLSRTGAAAISDPIQGAATAPIPIYQTLAGRQDPLPVNGAEQTQKTAATASEQKHEVHNEGLEAHWLEQEIANQIAIQKSLRTDPTTPQQSNPDAKKPGLAVPV